MKHFFASQIDFSMVSITHFEKLHRICKVIVTLEKVLDGSTLKVSAREVIKQKINGDEVTVVEWYDEDQHLIKESNYLEVLKQPEIGKEIGSLLLETRYKIIDIQD